MHEQLPRNFFVLYFSQIFISTALALFFIFILLSLWHDYSSALIAAVPFILMSAIPAFFSPLIGTHVDRYSKRKIGTYSLLLSIAALIPLFFVHSISITVAIFAFLLFLESYYSTNYTVCVRKIVGDKKLMQANNLWVVSMGISYLIAYSIGAYIYAFAGFTTILTLVLVFYSFSLLLFILARVPEMREKSDKIKYREVLSVLRSKKELLYLILIYDVAFFFIVLTKTPAYIPYFFNILKMSSVQYGIFNGLTTSLFVIVPLALHRVIKNTRIKEYAYASILGDGLVTLSIVAIPFIFASFTSRISALFLAILVGVVFSTLEMDSFMTIFQSAVAPEMLGRFYSVRTMFRGVVNVSAYIVGGYLADTAGPITLLMCAGILALALTLPVKKIVSRLV